MQYHIGLSWRGLREAALLRACWLCYWGSCGDFGWSVGRTLLWHMCKHAWGALLPGDFDGVGFPLWYGFVSNWQCSWGREGFWFIEGLRLLLRSDGVVRPQQWLDLVPFWVMVMLRRAWLLVWFGGGVLVRWSSKPSADSWPGLAPASCNSRCLQSLLRIWTGWLGLVDLQARRRRYS